MNLNPYRTINHKDWEISIYNYYNGHTTDSQILVVNSSTDKIEKFCSAIEKSSDIYTWTYNDEVVIDYEDDVAYYVGYGEQDFLSTDDEYIGRNRFDTGQVSFDDVADAFINNPSRAIPSWLTPTSDWVQESCDFESGWYGRHDDPVTILKNATNKNVIFQISNINQFAVQFCVWTQPKE